MNSLLFESATAWTGGINWPAVLAEFTLKSSLLILSGIGLSRWMVKTSAALRFRLLWLSLLGVPVLLLSSLLRQQEVVPLRYPVNVFDAPMSPSPDLRTMAQNELPASVAMSDPFSSSSATLTTPSSPAKPAWESLMLLVWLAGILTCALVMAVRLLRARRLSAKWTEVRDGRLFQLLSGVASQHNLPRVPRLLVCPSWIMPCTWGWRRPVIALPQEAKDWSGERLLHVLHHEVGHIVRKDASAHLLTFITLWPAWFNPLALVAKRQLSALREIACDDWVVTRGKANPLHYGTDLLALVKEHVQRGPCLHAPGFAVAQPSALGKRFRRLIDAGVNRNAPTARGKAALIAGWICLTGGFSMLISCRAEAPAPVTPTPPGGGSAATKVTTKVSPERARKGAKTIRYTIIEITVRDDDHSPSFLKPFLKAGGPDLIPFDSLQAISRIKGVDLLKSGEAKEGQRLLWKAVRPFPYPSEFSNNGTATSWDSSELGINTTLTGEVTNGGRSITARASLSVREFLGFLKYKLPSGSEVLQPKFTSRSFSDEELKIPNGGFVVLKNTPRQDVQSVEDVSWGGLVRKRWEEHYTRYLAIGAECDPLPPAARRSGIPRALTE